MTGRRHLEPRVALPGGGELHGHLSFAESPGPAALLYVHGFGSVRTGTKAEALEAACARRGWTFAAFEFRGHGASAGTLLELRGSSLLEDLDLFGAHLAGLGVRRLFPVGSSMGGWATAWFALRYPEPGGVGGEGPPHVGIPAAAFIAPAFEFLRARWGPLSEDARRTWERSRRLRVTNQGRGREEELDFALVEQADDFPSAELAARWTTPALIFHSLRDDAVPYQDSVNLLARTRCPAVELRLFTGGDHRQPLGAAEMAEEIGRFFARWW